MGAEKISKNLSSRKDILTKYEAIPPDGGWGFLVALGFVVAVSTTILPITCFGIVYRPFLERIGDVTSSIALISGLCHTSSCFIGLAANQLFQKFSYRKVGLLGAFLFITGGFSCIFVTTLHHMIIGNAIFQGMGIGLIMPAAFTALNSYFTQRRYVVMSVAQTILGFLAIFLPALLQKLIDAYGFRGTVAILAATSLNTIPAMTILQPVKWHVKLRRLSYTKIEKDIETDKIEGESLLVKSEHPVSVEDDYKCFDNFESHVSAVENDIEKRYSKEFCSFWNTVAKALDLELFKNVVYTNISIGIALALLGDINFMSIFPSLLNGFGFNSPQATLIMTTYFIADLIGRIFICFLCAVTNVRGRYVFLSGVTMSLIFRIAFTADKTFWWITLVSAGLGFCRSLIHVPGVPILQETYGSRFATAYSLYMVGSGFLSLGIGLLMTVIKDSTQSDILVVHFLTVVYLLCVVPWTIELAYFKFIKKQNVS